MVGGWFVTLVPSDTQPVFERFQCQRPSQPCWGLGFAPLAGRGAACDGVPQERAGASVRWLRAAGVPLLGEQGQSGSYSPEPGTQVRAISFNIPALFGALSGWKLPVNRLHVRNQGYEPFNDSSIQVGGGSGIGMELTWSTVSIDWRRR